MFSGTVNEPLLEWSVWSHDLITHDQMDICKYWRFQFSIMGSSRDLNLKVLHVTTE